MANQSVQTHPRYENTPNERRDERRAVEVGAAGVTAESIGAAGAIVLAIIGLAGILPHAMMAVTTIVLGAAILLDAFTVGTRYGRMMSDTLAGEESLVRMEAGGGISSGALGGIAGIVLGILAWLGYRPMLLCSVALIAFGATLLFGSAAKGRLAWLDVAPLGVSANARRLLDEAISLSASGEVLVGIGAVVLGILAVLMVEPLTLVLIGFLAVGAAMLLSSSALGARMLGVVRYRY